jgi:uncharacterized membrane protein
MTLNATGLSRTINKHCWLYVVAIGLIGSLALYLYGIPYGVDLPHHYRLAQGFFESFRSGDPYPSWLAFTNGGYGDPSVRFYPPALYYLLSCFRLITGNWYFASQLTLTLLTVIGGLGMYLWARTLIEGRYAVLAALLFILSPFHANEMYSAGLYAQYACASVLPFVFAFTERIIARGNWRDVGGLGVSYGLLLLFNMPLAVLGSISVGIYALVRLFQSFNRRSIFQLCVGILSGLALSCRYWLPMLLELRWKRPSGSGQGAWFDYSQNFIFRPSPNEMGDWWISILIIVTVLMAVPALVLLARRNRKALATALLALLSFLMATPLSKPVWDALTFLQETQFPWRWLTITSACLSLLVTISLPELIRMCRTRLRPLSFALVGIAIIALSFTVLQVIRGSRFQDSATFNQMIASVREAETNKDFLPLWAVKPRPMSSPAETADRSLDVVDWSSESMQFQIERGPETVVRLRLFYYPLWVATANGQPLFIKPDADGALLINVPPGEATVNLKFIEPASTRIATAISLFGLFLICALVIASALDRLSVRSSEMELMNPIQQIT